MIQTIPMKRMHQQRHVHRQRHRHRHRHSTTQIIHTPSFRETEQQQQQQNSSYQYHRSLSRIESSREEIFSNYQIRSNTNFEKLSKTPMAFRYFEENACDSYITSHKMHQETTSRPPQKSAWQKFNGANHFYLENNTPV